jgi:hypothetical protein
MWTIQRCMIRFWHRPRKHDRLLNGFSFGRPVSYISMDASIQLAAAIEHNTFAPWIAKLHLGGDDSFSSPIECIFIAANGPEGCANPVRQGLSADLQDGYRPNNVLGGIPTLALDCSPEWDAQLFHWTQDAAVMAIEVRFGRGISDSDICARRVDYGTERRKVREFRVFHQLPHRTTARLSAHCARCSISAAGTELRNGRRETQAIIWYARRNSRKTYSEWLNRKGDLVTRFGLIMAFFSANTLFAAAGMNPLSNVPRGGTRVPFFILSLRTTGTNPA